MLCGRRERVGDYLLGDWWGIPVDIHHRELKRPQPA